MNGIKMSSNTNETLEVCQSIIELSKSNPIVEDTYFTMTFDKVSALTNDLIGKVNEGWLKNDLKEKDELRDLDVRAIFYQVEASCVRRPDAKQEKALEVKDVLNRYGMSIVGGSYTNQSAQVRAMLSDLNAPELAKSVRVVSDLKQLMDNAEESQAIFDEAAAKLIGDKLERDSTKPASAIAKELREIFNSELSGYLTAMAQANPEKYKSFADLLNTLIESSNSKVRDRLAALKRKKEEAAIH